MYLILITLSIAAGAALVVTGSKQKNHLITGLGLLVWLGTFLVFGLLNFWGEMLWFHALGFPKRFWKVIFSKAGLGLAGALAGGMVVYLLTLPIPRTRQTARYWPEAAGVIFGAMIGFNSWEVMLVFVNRVPAGITDPILHRDAGFYLFSLPFYDVLYHFLFLLGGIALLAALAAAFLQVSGDDVRVEIPDLGSIYRPIYIALAFLLLVFAGGQYLNRFHLMTSSLGVVTGPGWTDVHVRMPGYWTVAIVSMIGALFLLIAPLRHLMTRLGREYDERKSGAGSSGQVAGNLRELAGLILPPLAVAAVWVLGLAVAPALAQWLRVEPNEITMERDYIEHNIRFTRHGFGMHDIEEREFPATGNLTQEMIDRNRDLMSEIRLWDWRALADVYEQFQEIRLYYTFPDVDIDRYTINGQYRQVMVSPREMDIGNLPEDSRTFVNKRFKYTHGYGLTMSTVRDFTPEGLPNLLIKDIPPVAEYPSLEVTQPQIYYGMLTDYPVVGNTEEKEFDYPRGDRNVYTHYKGHGGVELSNLWRKFIYGWMFDGTRFLLSGYPTAESRMLFHRKVLDRVRRVAPFLRFETDPYIVLHEGRLFWIVDAYTVSDRFPYSEPFSSREMRTGANNRWTRGFMDSVAPQLKGANYVRNSVKVVLDAYHGDLSFYVFEPDDPVVKVWRNIFPNVFKAKEEMPAGLRAHVRYPSTLLLVQGLVYTKYHMTDPTVFYNQEDLWVRATEKYYQQVQPVEPYYIMWKLPDTDDPQFTLIQPFTPKNKQVLIGWMAGMCDGENYGRLLAYKFPKEKRVLGPQQVETKIDQDRHLSGQLTLWDQRGSKVIRGNVLAIPIEKTLIYVEPIYLQAETAAYPELRLVAVMHGDNLSYAETFDQALEGLVKPGKPQKRLPGEQRPPSDTGTQVLIRQAGEAFNNYLKLQGEKKFNQAADELNKLQQALEQLIDDK